MARRLSRVVIAGSVSILTMWGSSACAVPLVGGVTAAEVAAALQAKNFVATIDKDGGGDPKIISGAQGSSFEIFFYGCHKTPRCASIEFSAGYHVEPPLKAEQVNSWNRSMRYGRAYLDNTNDPIVEMDVYLDDGSSMEALEYNIGTWDELIGSFRRFVKDCGKAPDSEACKEDTK